MENVPLSDSPLNDLERKIANVMNAQSLKGSHLLLAVSGGVDSMVGLNVLNRLKDLWSLQLSVAHYHHGRDSAKEQELFRDDSLHLVQRVCEDLDIPIYSSKRERTDRMNEAVARDERYSFLNQIHEQLESDFVVLFHHKNDLLETRLIRLIRGVGDTGIESMSVLKDQKLRPFIEITKMEILAYAKDRNVSFLSDPSNDQDGHMRNWIRRNWLAPLEKKRPGSIDSLSRSLEILAQKGETGDQVLDEYYEDNRLFRAKLEALEFDQKKRVIASFLRDSGILGYGSSHISEILKRLNTDQKKFSFTMLKREWIVDASQVEVVTSEL